MRLPFPIKGKTVNPLAKIRRREWQEDAWDVFDDVPEIKYSVWFEGNVMAKCKLFAAVLDPSDPEAIPIPLSDPASGIPAAVAQRAQAEIERLKGELGGQGEILRAMNMNLEIAAEGYIIGIGPRETEVKDDAGMVIDVEITPESWGVFSVSQVTQKDDTYTLRMRPDDQNPFKLNPELDSEPIRIWQRHPRWSYEADCNMRGVLSDCEALILLGNSIKAVAKSQMNAGFLLVPSDLSSGPDVETDPEGEEEAGVDAFEQALYDGVTEPVEDPSSAASVAPTIIRGQAESLKEFRHVTIDRKSDDSVLAKITSSIERIARGLNLPVEVVMGHQQTTFANAMQVKQDTFDDHFQPRCVLICDALTISFLRPNLIAAGMDPELAEKLVIWFDPSAMIKQVNPVDSADNGVNLDLLSGEAWRRAWGWSEDDAPDPVERLTRAVMHLRTFDPGISTAILELFGVPLNIPSDLPSAGTTSTASTTAARSSGLDGLLAAAIRARYGDTAREQGGERTLEQLLVDVLEHDPSVNLSAAASGLPSPAKVAKNPGYDHMLLDRDLRMKLLVAADQAMTRALERAGNKLRAKAGQTRTLARAGFIHPVYVAATLGPNLVAAAGFADEDLISTSAWSGLEANYRTWVAAVQATTLVQIAKLVTLTDTQRADAVARQERDLESSWAWLKEQLTELAAYRLYSPDPTPPAKGEFDATSKVPAGMMRQALARAGGATGITIPSPKLTAAARRPGGDQVGAPVYVAVNDGQPLGGVATGQLATELITENDGADVDAYEWVYGPAYRLNPFEEHEALDEEVFTDFDSDVLVAGNWVGDYYFPGDHDGCNCDIAPVIVSQASVDDSTAASGLTELGDVPES